MKDTDRAPAPPAFTTVHYVKDEYPVLRTPVGDFMVKGGRADIQELADYCNDLADRLVKLESDRWRRAK